MSDDARKAFQSYLSEWKARSLIVEFKGAFSAVSGVFSVSAISESNLRLRLAVSTCLACELDICLPALRSFSVTTLTEAMNSVLKPAVEALVAEPEHSFHADVVEQVGVVGLADGSTLLIGVLKEEIGQQAASSLVAN